MDFRFFFFWVLQLEKRRKKRLKIEIFQSKKFGDKFVIFIKEDLKWAHTKNGVPLKRNSQQNESKRHPSSSHARHEHEAQNVHAQKGHKALPFL